MNYCQNCGASVREKSRYCKSCGSFLKPVEKFSVEEGNRKFCQNCGGAIGKRYCPTCGSYGKEEKIKNSVLNVGKFFGGTGKPKSNSQNPGKQGNVGSVKELFTNLFAVREDWKNSALNAGLFALMLAFLLGMLVFVIDVAIKEGMIYKLKMLNPSEDDLFVLKKIINAMDFKTILWMLFTGSKLQGSMTDGLNNNIDISFVLPFISMPILILLIWLIEVARKALFKVERTFYMAAMQSGIFAFFSAILTLIFSKRASFQAEGKTEEVFSILQEIGEIFEVNLENQATLSVGCNVISVFFTMLIITFLALLILPGLKVEHDVWRKVRKMITVFLGVILCMTVIPGMVSAIVLVSKIPWMNFGIGILIFIMATGMYSTAIFNGDTQWCDFSTTLPDILRTLDEEMNLDFFSVQAKTSWTKFFCKISGSEFLGDDGATVSSMPFAALHICMIVVGVIALLYISIKVWGKISCDWQVAAILSLITGAGCAVFLGLLHKLFYIGGTLKIGTYTLKAYIGGEAVVSTFLKEMLLIGLLCMAGYFIWHFTAGKIAPFMAIKTKWVSLTVCGACLVISVLGVTNIQLRNFQPVTENVVAETYDFVEENIPDGLSYEMDRESAINEVTSESMKIINEILEYNPKMKNESY